VLAVGLQQDGVRQSQLAGAYCMDALRPICHNKTIFDKLLKSSKSQVTVSPASWIEAGFCSIRIQMKSFRSRILSRKKGVNIAKIWKHIPLNDSQSKTYFVQVFFPFSKVQ
jgi:hypothetical protein